MDFSKLFFSPDGRISRQEFWLAWVILLLVRLFTFIIPLIGFITWIGCFYCGVCIRAKRLHDMGRTGWWQIIPHVGNLVFIVAAIWFGVIAAIAGLTWGSFSSALSGVGLAAGITTLNVTGLAACLLDLAFLLWIGVAEAEPYENRFGPGPAERDYRTSLAV